MKLTAFFAMIACWAIAEPGFAQGLIQPTAISANSNTTVARAPDSRGWTDPALNHNKLLQQQAGDGAYIIIGPYKVKGTPFLFGEHHQADVFSPTEKAYNIFINYNTYNQEVEFYSTANPDKPLVKEQGTIDSFIIHQDAAIGIANSLKFIYGPVLGINDKSYYQVIYSGKRFSVYKKYKSDLSYPGDSYVQSDLRQFDLQYDYYYADSLSKGAKKLKKNAAGIIKEFKGNGDISSIVTADGFNDDPEAVLRRAFEFLNKDL